jgi:hypothetical protein
MSNFSNFVNKAKELASEHPDQVHSALDKIESLVNEKTDGKYADKIAKGEQLVEKQLGVPEDEAQDGSTNTPR